MEAREPLGRRQRLGCGEPGDRRGRGRGPTRDRRPDRRHRVGADGPGHDPTARRRSHRRRRTSADLVERWMREELPFVEQQRPWERSFLTVAGASDVAHDPSTEVVVAPPLRVPAPAEPATPLLGVGEQRAVVRPEDPRPGGAQDGVAGGRRKPARAIAPVGLRANPFGPRAPAGLVRRQRLGIGVISARHSASTSASSSAIAAPSAMFGEVACAASPTSTTCPRTERRGRPPRSVRRARRASMSRIAGAGAAKSRAAPGAARVSRPAVPCRSSSTRAPPDRNHQSAARCPSITDQVVTSCGQVARRRQPSAPTGAPPRLRRRAAGPRCVSRRLRRRGRSDRSCRR